MIRGSSHIMSTDCREEHPMSTTGLGVARIDCSIKKVYGCDAQMQRTVSTHYTTAVVCIYTIIMRDESARKRGAGSVRHSSEQTSAQCHYNICILNWTNSAHERESQRASV